MSLEGWHQEESDREAEYDDKITQIMKEDGVSMEVAEYMIENNCGWQQIEGMLFEKK